MIVKIDARKYSAYGAMSGEESNISVISNGDDVIVSASPDSVSDKVTMYDGVGNVSDINTRSIDRGTQADTDGPVYQILYANGKYVLHVEDVSGIENIIGKRSKVVIHTVEGQPTEWTSEASVNPVVYVNGQRIEERALVVSDGVGNETEIPLQVDDGLGARVAWKYNRHGKVCVKVVDTVGMTKATLEHGEVIAEYEDNPLEIELEIDAQNEDYVKVTDVFGHENMIPLYDVTMTVDGAYMNADGSRIAVSVENRGRGIGKIAYEDGRVIDPDVEEGKREIYDVDAGTDKIRIYYDQDVYAVVSLEEDTDGASVPGNENGGRLYKGNGYVVIKTVDEETGIGGIEAGESVSFDGDKNEVIRRLVLGGVNTVVVRDGLGNETSLDIGGIEEDVDVPQASIRYIREDDRYEIEMRDSKVGLWKVVKNRNEELVDYTYEMYPREENLVLDDMRGVRVIEVYDAVGNVMEINLDDVLCIVIYIYKNANDDKVAISVEDMRGIKKVAVEKRGRERVVEKYKVAQDKVCRCYGAEEGIDAVRIYSGDNKMMRWGDIETYEVEPTVDGNSVYSLVGIHKLEYDDGVVVEFKQDMPTKVDVDLRNHDSVYVSDALDNGVMMRY